VIFIRRRRLDLRQDCVTFQIHLFVVVVWIENLRLIHVDEWSFVCIADGCQNLVCIADLVIVLYNLKNQTQ